ncbi:MAG: hypothetical protein ACYC1E_13440 [Propionibacteriaceae bacterium]
MTIFKKVCAVTGGALAALALGGGLAFAGAANAHAVTMQEPSTAVSGVLAATAVTTGDTEVADGTETATEAATESATASDGPGGHADPAGDVQHEGGATEQ